MSLNTVLFMISMPIIHPVRDSIMHAMSYIISLESDNMPAEDKYGVSDKSSIKTMEYMIDGRLNMKG
jgi:hypothetical protein